MALPHRLLPIACMAAGLFAADMAVRSTPAMADAGSFLRSIAGDWRGRGTAKIPGRETEERISCKVQNQYDDSGSALVVRGNCATTQSKSSVSGKLEHSGNRVSGSLIGAFAGATITKSDGEVAGGQLVVSTNFVDNATGTLTRSRQVIRKTGGGFKADFYLYDNKLGKFAKAGSLDFTAQ